MRRKFATLFLPQLLSRWCAACSTFRSLLDLAVGRNGNQLKGQSDTAFNQQTLHPLPWFTRHCVPESEERFKHSEQQIIAARSSMIAWARAVHCWAEKFFHDFDYFRMVYYLPPILCTNQVARNRNAALLKCPRVER